MTSAKRSGSSCTPGSAISCSNFRSRASSACTSAARDKTWDNTETSPAPVGICARYPTFAHRALDTLPLSGSSRPASRRSKVVLPTPLRPNRATFSALSTLKVTLRRTGVAPWDLARSELVRMAIPHHYIGRNPRRSTPADSLPPDGQTRNGPEHPRSGPLPASFTTLQPRDYTSVPILIPRYRAIPVPAGISLPMITFSFNPSNGSTFPLVAASVRTRAVSCKDAADRQFSVASVALVIPTKTGGAFAAPNHSV